MSPTRSPRSSRTPRRSRRPPPPTDAAKASLDLSRLQYKDGYAAYLAVLNADQAYQQARLSLVQAEADRFTDTAALFQALGGGWWHRPELVSTPCAIGRYDARDRRCACAAPCRGLLVIAGRRCRRDHRRRQRPADKAQRAHIQLYTVVPVGYRQTHRGARDGRFRQRPGDSGRVAVHRPGDAHLRRARPACREGPAAGGGRSPPMYANAVAAYRKAAVAAANARRVAAADRDLAAHNGISAARSGPGRKPMRQAPKPTGVAALQALASMGAKPGRPGSSGHVIRAPVSGVVVEKDDHAGPIAAGRLIRRLHRRQPVAGLGARADRAERSSRGRLP